MSDFPDLEQDAPLRRALLAAALLMVLVPFLQVGSQLWPLQFGNIRWRFDAANSLTGILLIPFLGFSLLQLLARVIDSDTLRTLVGLLAALFGVGLLVSAMAFLLDALQLKTIVSSAMLVPFQATMLRVLSLATAYAVGFLFLAIAGFRTGRRRVSSPAPEPRRSARRSRSSSDDVGLIVGLD